MARFLISALLLIIISCSRPTSTGEQPTNDGPCGYLTNAEVEDALGHLLEGDPKEINEESKGGKGCSYSAGYSPDGEAFFVYITFPSAELFNKNREGSTPVEGVGEEAYRTKGADAHQLWARSGNQYVLVAIGERPNENGSKQLARLVLDRMQN